MPFLPRMRAVLAVLALAAVPGWGQALPASSPPTP